ncbi:MAG: T9SS type A sorting domain-containing protein, partial [Flavobacteriales bacterium]|nr:T9SS type A sorting domain-containing protein [Flavobacteriales bacterium]
TLGTQTLDYTSGTSGFGIGWNGGNGGCAVYIEPPYYPAQITASNFWITTVGVPPGGFHAVIYDDNGRGPGQGTVLDSNFINFPAISFNQYHRVPTNNPIVISSGGIYLLWLMDGANINLGRNFVTPASQRTYEIILGSWSEYRDNTTQDFKMNIEISPVTTVGLQDIGLTKSLVNIYPNPSKDKISVQLKDGFQPTIIEILDMNGKQVELKVMRLQNQIQIFRSGIKSGTYFLRLDKQVTPIIFVD